MTAQQYQRLSAPFRPHRALLERWNRILTLCGYVCYPLVLVLLLCTDRGRLLRGVLVPALGFGGLTLVRRGINAPRPYEALDIHPLIHKDTRGNSMPSRHVFSLFLIAMTWLWVQPWVGAVLLALGAVLALIRVIGGVHFPRDVLVGAAAALVWGLVGYWLI